MEQLGSDLCGCQELLCKGHFHGGPQSLGQAKVEQDRWVRGGLRHCTTQLRVGLQGLGE